MNEALPYGMTLFFERSVFEGKYADLVKGFTPNCLDLIVDLARTLGCYLVNLVGWETFAAILLLTGVFDFVLFWLFVFFKGAFFDGYTTFAYFVELVFFEFPVVAVPFFFTWLTAYFAFYAGLAVTFAGLILVLAFLLFGTDFFTWAVCYFLSSVLFWDIFAADFSTVAPEVPLSRSISPLVDLSFPASISTFASLAFLSSVI